MKRKAWLLLCILAAMLACQVIPTPPALRATPRHPATETRSPILSPQGTQTSASLPTTGQPTPTSAPPGELAPISGAAGAPFAEINLPAWSLPRQATNWPIELPVPLDQVSNLGVTDGLTLRQRNKLSQNGFVIVHSQEPQFNNLRQRVSLFYGQPYFLTTDAADHALKITLDELWLSLEREELQRRLKAVVQATFDQVQTYFPLVVGSELEGDAHTAAAYLGVAVRLLDANAPLDPELETQVAPQVEQILAGRGIEEARLLPGFQDDFRLYQPPRIYRGDTGLQAYFRALTWLERVEFPVQASSTAGQVNHVPLIVTLALRQAMTENGPAAAEWVRITETLDFISGPRQGGGPAEYARVMDQIYGRMVTVLSLRDSTQLETFRSLLNDLPFPGLGANIPGAEAQNGGRLQTWSFLGRRSDPDLWILHQLAAETPAATETPRLPPGGLELMATLGGSIASQAMKSSGAEFRADPQAIQELQIGLQDQLLAAYPSSERWAWLESYRQLLAPEADFMQARAPFASTSAWAYKELNSALGSWAEQQRETPVYPSPAETETSESKTLSPPAPGYVEPNPPAFYQLSRLAFMVAEGLKQRDLMGVFTANPDTGGLNRLVLDMFDLGDRLQRLGDIAARELAGDSLTAIDYALIQAPLGPAEERSFDELLMNPDGPQPKMPGLPLISAFDYGSDRILEMGVGGADRIYVLVPLEGQIVIAQGGVYSYFEFPHNRERPLDSESWSRMLFDAPPEPPGWVKDLYLPEGVPLNVLAYRIGDLYQVRPAAVKLNLRASPSIDAKTIQITVPGEILKIVDGPVRANALNWWKVQLDRSPTDKIEGWIYEKQEWFARAWYK